MGLLDEKTVQTSNGKKNDKIISYYDGVYNNDGIDFLFIFYFDDKFDSLFLLLFSKQYRINLSKYGLNKYSFIDEQVFILSDIIKKISDLIILYPKINIYSYIEILKFFINNSMDIDTLYNKIDDYLISLLINMFNSKDDILAYVIDRYIENGYCYHGFNYSFESNIRTNGLGCNSEIIYGFKSINGVFEKYGISSQKPNSYIHQNDNSFFTTDNFGASYYYALLSPVFFSRLISNGCNTYGKEFDRLSYYTRNIDGIINNVLVLLKNYNVDTNDMKLIINKIKELLNILFKEKNSVSIAVIDRANIKRNIYNYKFNDMDVKDSIKSLLKPHFELDFHNNTIYSPSIIRYVKIKNYTKLISEKYKYRW